ncbi:MAG: hypothetical protein K0S44_167 [Bacteroidetes bacterium]|jgi:hypothetical protein|nr:hypothetical protein [Bacteroidota bacterium]
MSTNFQPLKNILTLLILTLILESCGNENSKDKTQESQTQNSDSLTGNKDSVLTTTVYSLPAPMQIATAIKKSKAPFREELLCPLKTENISSFHQTVVLGIFAVDLGYANVYDQGQTSLNYFTNSLKLADELKFLGHVHPALVKEFKNLINNKDSVTFYTLSSFNNIRKNLVESNRSDDAYLIFAGSYIEGLYLTLKSNEKANNPELVQLLGIQKLFLKTLLELLPDYKDKKGIETLLAQLTDLKTTYDKIDMKFSDSSVKNTKNIEPLTVSDDVLKDLTGKITTIRNSIILPTKEG